MLRVSAVGKVLACSMHHVLVKQRQSCSAATVVLFVFCLALCTGASGTNGSVTPQGSVNSEVTSVDDESQVIIFSDNPLPVPPVQLDISQCSGEEGTEHTGELGLIQGTLGTATASSTPLVCLWTIRVPSGLFLSAVLEVKEPCSSDQFKVSVADQSFYNLSETVLSQLTCFSHVAQVLSAPRNELYFQWTENTHNPETLLRFTIRFQATKLPLQSHLELVPWSPYSGYIAPYGYDGVRVVTSNLNAVYHLNVPLNHLVLLSFFENSGVKMPLELNVKSVKTDGSQTIYREFLAVSVRFHTILCASCSTVIFEARARSTDTGFKARFSFHNDTEASHIYSSFSSRQLYVNCSVPYYDSFRRHVQCNAQPDCYGGEDEGTHCLPSSSGCDDLYSIGDKCFYFESGFSIFRSPLENCVLPILKTSRELSAFRNALRYFDIADEYIALGLVPTNRSWPDIYRKSIQWLDGTVAYEMNFTLDFVSEDKSGTINIASSFGEIAFYLFTGSHAACQLNSSRSAVTDVEGVTLSRIKFQTTNQTGSYIPCPHGHVTHAFLACDPSSDCGTKDFVQICEIHMSTASDRNELTTPYRTLPMFSCDDPKHTLHYTLVCNFRADCPDSSDETFCVRPDRCHGYRCRSGECVESSEVCDFVRNCVDGSDEEDCQDMAVLRIYRLPPPAVVDFQYGGDVVQKKLTASQACPETHFRCPGESDYCLPVFVRCNGVYDCNGHEDELDCQTYTCPGFYRCRSSTVCVHADHLCDGLPHCPQHDDEFLCDFTCPEGCLCHGLAFVCQDSFAAQSYPELRYLDATGSGMRPERLESNFFLTWLSLAACELQDFPVITLPNLQDLDLSQNKLKALSMAMLHLFPNLRELRVANNPLASLVPDDTPHRHLNLKTLDISYTGIEILDGNIFSNVPLIESLNVSYGQMSVITENGFSSVRNLRTLDIRGRSLQRYPRNLLKDLTSLHTVYTENYDLCCQALLPDSFDRSFCFAPDDEISSCEAFLRSDIYRVFLWVMASAAVIGNAGSFIYRQLIQRNSFKSAFNLFVTNLCVADFLMGLYLCIIGSADQIFSDYILNKQRWISSVACKMGGFVSFLSSEVSAFMICLITLDRFIVLRFPFSHIHFKVWSGCLACLIAWVVGVVLAGIPLLPMTSHWEFYSQTGICIPLPITRTEFAGRDYSFGVMIVLNFVLFLMIALGQAFIFWSVRLNTMTTDTTKRSQDMTIARRLITIAVSDFLCWFPIGLLGLLAASGVAVAGEFNVITAIFVLPLNSALNPFLYTYNVLAEKRRKARETRLLKMLEAQMATESSDCT